MLAVRSGKAAAARALLEAGADALATNSQVPNGGGGGLGTLLGGAPGFALPLGWLGLSSGKSGSSRSTEPWYRHAQAGHPHCPSSVLTSRRPIVYTATSGEHRGASGGSERQGGGLPAAGRALPTGDAGVGVRGGAMGRGPGGICCNAGQVGRWWGISEWSNGRMGTALGSSGQLLVRAECLGI